MKAKSTRVYVTVSHRDRKKWNAYMRKWRKKRTALLKKLKAEASPDAI